MAEKQERRSIADAMNMTPEALAFIKGAPEKTIEVKQTFPRKEMATHEMEFESEERGSKNDPGPTPKTPTESPRRRPYRSSDARHRETAHQVLGFGMNNLLVPLTTRLQASTAAALKRAGLEQKLRGQEPSTVQEIAETALRTWLREEGYLR